LAFYSFKIPL